MKFEDLIRFEQLGGRGCATKVRIRGGGAKFFVYKGVDYRTFLSQRDDQDNGRVIFFVKTWHHSNNLIATMPPHSNILRPATIAVTITSGSRSEPERVICGCLYEFYANGDVGARIEDAIARDIRIPLKTKSTWCFQMVDTIHHTHRVAHSYHMDIKPTNFLIDNDGNLILIDWEQSDAPATTLAPEADGTWDVEEVSRSDDLPELVYRKYTGPRRQNMDEDAPGTNPWNIWNVFPIWSAIYPRALELAEVFSIGKTMWMVLRQPSSEGWDDIDHPNDLVSDWDGTDDIPVSWKSTVEQCIAENPNQRPDMAHLKEMLLTWLEERE